MFLRLRFLSTFPFCLTLPFSSASFVKVGIRLTRLGQDFKIAEAQSKEEYFAMPFGRQQESKKGTKPAGGIKCMEKLHTLWMLREC